MPVQEPAAQETAGSTMFSKISFSCTPAARSAVLRALQAESVPLAWGNAWTVDVHDGNVVFNNRPDCSVRGAPRLVLVEDKFADSGEHRSWCLPEEEEGELKKLATEWEEMARRYTEAANEIRRRFAPIGSWWVAFSTSAGNSVSTGYVAGPFASENEAEAERVRLMEEGVELNTELYVLGPSDHECRVPGWGACSQCQDEK